MAREYARVKVTIWADTDFRSLTPKAQHLYFMLLTSPNLNMAGIADWRPQRIVRMAAGWTTSAVTNAAEELEDRGFIVIDEDSEEVLVRSFVRHDGVLKSPNITRAMVKDYAAAGSDLIRETIAQEVQRGAREEPDAKGLPQATELLNKPESNQSERVSEQFENVSPIPHPSTSSPQPRRLVTHREHVASLLGWEARDERLDKLDDYLQANGVRNPRAWLTRLHQEGDLEAALAAHDDTSDHDDWSHLPETPPDPA